MTEDRSRAAGEKELRHEPPYWFTFTTNAKARWYGRRILDVLVEEFRDRTKHYYVWAIHKELLKINGKAVLPSHIVRNGDVITHTAHKHEPPIANDPVRILYHNLEEGRIVVVKPGSVPVHPAGRYLRHTLLELLKSDHGIEKVYTANRLDRLTSGIMVASTNVAAAKALSVDFDAGRVRKAYVCRVQGCFPETETTCEMPLLSLDRQTGVVIVHPAGRPAKTIFNRLSYDAESDTSVLFCRPITGRTHQIRVHVQILGYPIPNDPIYNHPVWGSLPPLSFFDIPVPSTSQADGAHVEAAANVNSATVKYLAATPSCATLIETLKNTKDEGEDWSRLKDEVRFAQWNKEHGWLDGEDVTGINAGPAQGVINQENALGYCDECHLPFLPDPPATSLFIYLHAIRYETDAWSFEDEMPWWAQEGWTDPDARSRAKDMREKGQAVRPPKLKLLSEVEGMGAEPTEASPQKPAAADTAYAASASAPPQFHPLLQHSLPSDKRIPSLPSESDHAAVVLEVFRGLEDFALKDLLARLGPHSVLPESIQTAIHSSYLRLPPQLTPYALDTPIPFASAKHIFLGATLLPEDLLAQLESDRAALGTVSIRNRNNREKRKVKSGRSKQKGDEAAEEPDAESPARSAAQQPSATPTPAESVSREADGRISSEVRLLSFIAELWASQKEVIEDGLEAWKKQAHKNGKLPLDKHGWTYRATVDRSMYKLPTMVSTDLECHLGECAWPILNGDVRSTEDPPHPVCLTDPDLEVELAFVPWWGTDLLERSGEPSEVDVETPKGGTDDAEGVRKAPTGPVLAEAPKRKTKNLSFFTQAWEHNPPGSLVLMLKVKEDEAAVFPHRPTIENELTDGGTAFARFRAHTLASLLPIPKSEVAEGRKADPLLLWEPCVGTGSIAIELASAFAEKDISARVFGSDIEQADIERARIVSKRSGWPDATEGTSPHPHVSVFYKNLDFREYDACLDWFRSCGPQGTPATLLDGIVTDLPWGRRVLSHGALQALYTRFLHTCLATLKPWHYAVVLTLEHKTLQRSVVELEGSVRRDLAKTPGQDTVGTEHVSNGAGAQRSQKWTMRMQKLDTARYDQNRINDGAEHSDATDAHYVDAQGMRQAEETACGSRPVEMGLRPFVFLLRKVPL